MSDENYGYIYRPTYEWIPAATWAASAAAAAAAAAWFGLPDIPFYAVVVLGAGMTSTRVRQAWRHRRRKAALAGQPKSFITLEQLQQHVDKHPDELFIGYGFDWDQRHCQRAHDLLWSDSRDVVGAHDGIGYGWIHGVELDEKPLYLPLSETYGHTLLTGTTRSFKGIMLKLVIAQAILRGETVLVIDPKGDQGLSATMKAACDYIGAPERYQFFHPGFAEDSVRIDPLRNFTRGSELASRIAALIPSETGADPFAAFGQMALSHVINGMLYTHRHPSLATVRRYLEGGVDELVVDALTAYCQDHVARWEERAKPYLKSARDTRAKGLQMAKFYREEVVHEAPSSDIEGLLSLFEHDREHFQKMVASLLPILSMLTSGQLGPLMSPDPTDPDDPRPITDTARMIQAGQAVYIGLDSLTDGMVAGAIGAILLSDLTAVAGDRYNYEDQVRPVNIIADEMSEAICDPLIQSLNKGAGAGFRFWAATQTFADFAAGAGSQDKARMMLGNLNNRITGRVIDGETQEYVAQALPETRVRYIMQQQNANVSPDEPLHFSGGVGQRLMEETVPMFPQQLFGAIPNAEYFAMLSGGRLLKARIPILEVDEQSPPTRAGQTDTASTQAEPRDEPVAAEA